MSAAQAIEAFKKSISTGVTVLRSIASRNGDLRADINSAIDEVANLAEKGNFYQAKKLTWEKVDQFGKVTSERELTNATELLESLDGQFPDEKAEASTILDAAQKDFDGKRFGDASRKARQASGILYRLHRQDAKEFANSIRGLGSDLPDWKTKLADLKE